MTATDYDTSTPALLLLIGPHEWDYGALATVRTLGRVGVPIYVALGDPRNPAVASKYLTAALPWVTTGGEDDDLLVDGIRQACGRIGRPAVAIAGDDESAVLIARRADDLQDVLILPDVPSDLPDKLAGKAELAALCQATDTPTPASASPDSVAQALGFAAAAHYPLVVKNPAPFSRLVDRSVPATTRVSDDAELTAVLADWSPGSPLLIQEFIPSEVSEDWYVEAVMSADGNPVVAFSGRKLRAYPDATGIGTLSESVYNAELIEQAVAFCAAVGYAGVCDMDWRLDRRDGQFKLLDFNPRRGAQFRLFRSTADVDVVRALHLHLTGRTIPPGTQVDGIRHVVGISDQRAYLAGRRSKSGTAGLGPLQGKGAERAWWAADDPRPAWEFVRQLGPVEKVLGRR